MAEWVAVPKGSLLPAGRPTGRSALPSHPSAPCLPNGQGTHPPGEANYEELRPLNPVLRDPRRHFPWGDRAPFFLNRADGSGETAPKLAPTGLSDLQGHRRCCPEHPSLGVSLSSQPAQG